MPITAPISVTESSALAAQKKTCVSSERWEAIFETHNYDSSALKSSQDSTEKASPQTQQIPQKLDNKTPIVSVENGKATSKSDSEDKESTAEDHSQSADKGLDTTKKQMNDEGQNSLVPLYYINSSYSINNLDQSAESTTASDATIASEATTANLTAFSNVSIVTEKSDKTAAVNSLSSPKTEEKSHRVENYNGFFEKNFSEEAHGNSSSSDLNATSESDNAPQATVQNTLTSKETKSSTASSTPPNEHALSRKNTKDTDLSNNTLRNEVPKLDLKVQISNVDIQNKFKLDQKKTNTIQYKINPTEGMTDLNNNFKVNFLEPNAQANLSPNVNATSLAPSALSATITALHKSGQNGILLRLDPPNLGHLGIQIKMDAQGSVNVSFVPSSTDAAHALLSSLPQLGAALGQSGLSLGQTEIAGQFSQSNQQHNPSPQPPPTSRRQIVSNTAEDITASPSYPKGLSFYA